MLSTGDRPPRGSHATVRLQERGREREPAQGEQLKEKRETARFHGDSSYILGWDARFSGRQQGRRESNNSEATFGCAEATASLWRFRGDERLSRVEIRLIIGHFWRKLTWTGPPSPAGGGGEDAHATEQPGGFVATVADQSTHWTFVASAVTRWPPGQQAARKNSCPTSRERETVGAAANIWLQALGGRTPGLTVRTVCSRREIKEDEKSSWGGRKKKQKKQSVKEIFTVRVWVL